MKRLSREAWLAIALFIALLLVTLAAAVQQTQEAEAPPLASFSSAPDGARALWLWLEELGYPVSDELQLEFQPPEAADMMLILEPFLTFTTEEWEVVDSWVEEGGTLLLAGDQFGTAMAAGRYRFNIDYLSPMTTTLTSQTPLFASPPADPAPVRLRAYLETERDDFVTHLAIEAGPVMVSFERGAGRVILCTAPFIFSNAGLKEAGNPALVLNVITAAGSPELIWFDEWHHGRRADQTGVTGPGDWLRYTPAGRSLLYVALVLFVALVLRGRRFGRPISLPEQQSRRGPLEYITAIANLGRRAGHRTAVMRQYHHHLKRGLGHRYRLNPTLPDEAYVEALAKLNPNLKADALLRLLVRLRQPDFSESEMIHLAAEVAGWLKES
jgi:hypothetical protein